MFKFKQDEIFIPAPEGMHNAVIADVVYYGTEEAYDKIRLVWELEQSRPSGKRFTVTKPFYDAASMTKDLQQVLGDDREGIDIVMNDPEKLIGMPMRLKVVHNLSKGEIFPHVHSLYPPSVVRLLVTPGFRRYAPDKKTGQSQEAA